MCVCACIEMHQRASMEHRATCTRSQGRQGCRAHDDDDSIDCSMVVDLSSSERALVLDLRASRFRLHSSSLSCSTSTSSTAAALKSWRREIESIFIINISCTQRRQQEHQGAEQEVPNDVIDTICPPPPPPPTHTHTHSAHQCSTRSFSQ